MRMLGEVRWLKHASRRYHGMIAQCRDCRQCEDRRNEAPSKKLKYAAIQHSIEYIKREFGIDIGEKERQQLVPEMMDTADLAIIIAEKERWPGYLKEDDKVVFWDLPDPARMADGAADEVYKEVQRRVEQLVAKIG